MYVVKPEKIEEPVKFDFDDFVMFLLAQDKRFNENGAGIRAAVRIESAVEKCKELHYLESSQEDLKMLGDAAEQPSSGYPTLRGVSPDGSTVAVSLARKCLPFIDALKEPSSSPPEKKEEEVSE
jgi:hypothetical protein